MAMRSFFSKQFLHFLLAGGVAAVVNFCVGYGLSGKLPFYGDIVMGYLAGMLTAFLLFEKHVFGEHAESRKKSVVVFVGVNLLGLLQTWLVYFLLKDHIFPAIALVFYPAEISRAIAIIVPTLSSFIGHKYFTFKQ